MPSKEKVVLSLGMGGAILEKHFGIKPKRIDRESYLGIQSRVLDKLSPHFRAALVAPQVEEKADFGDCDVLVLGSDVSDVIQSVFGVKPHRVAMTYSFPFEDFQIDVVPFESRVDLDFAHSYYAYNDLNTISSEIYKKRGLKYGPKGLFFRADNTLVSKNPHVIRYLGGWDKGHDHFKTFNEAFEWVTTSRFFDPCLYLGYETRDRPMRVAWLKWLDEHFG